MGLNILLTGSTGMVGSEIMNLCLKSNKISKIVSLTRNKSNLIDKKLEEVIISDFLNLDSYKKYFKSIDVVFYCLGIYTGSTNRKSFRMITVDYPFALAKQINKYSNSSIFVLLSGQGADKKEKSKFMFARDKGVIENKLNLIFGKKFYSVRPGYIYPVERREEPNLGYVISRRIYPLIKLLGRKFSITSKELARAILYIGIKKPKKNIFENIDLISII